MEDGQILYFLTGIGIPSGPDGWTLDNHLTLWQPVLNLDP